MNDTQRKLRALADSELFAMIDNDPELHMRGAAQMEIERREALADHREQYGEPEDSRCLEEPWWANP
jgi:hypothetical protein